MYINIQVKAVIKRQGLGIFPGYYEYGPRIVLYQENKRNREPKEIPSCLIPCLLVAFTLNIKFSGLLCWNLDMMKSQETWQNTFATKKFRCSDSLFRGGSRIFFRRGCTRLLLYFNTNKPHIFFFLQNASCFRKPQVISGGGMRTPCTLPLDLPLLFSILYTWQGISFVISRTSL